MFVRKYMLEIYSARNILCVCHWLAVEISISYKVENIVKKNTLKMKIFV